MNPRFRRFALAGALAGALLLLPLPAQTIKTPAEESGWSRYTQYKDLTRFLEALDGASTEISVQVIGHTLQGKDFAPADLYLCIITEEGAESPEKLNRRKPTVMIVASQHGNEQSAKEAALRIVRDLATGDLKPLLKQLNFLVIPQANPYGNFANQRRNEQDLDLNRDHVKLESPETRAIHKVFRAWMPEVTLDLHEKGDDYYRVSTGCVSNINIDPKLERYSREKIFPALDRRVTADGFTWHEYLVTEAMGSNQAAGAPDRPGQGRRREILQRPSTTDLNDGRNSLGIYDSLSFIQECSSRHDIPTLEQRTGWQYSGIRALIRTVAEDGRNILSLVRECRSALAAKAAKVSADDVVHLKMEYVRDPKQPELTLKAFERPRRGEPRQNDNGEQKVVTRAQKNWFPKVESRLEVVRPLGYIVPAERKEVIKTLLDHGIELEVLTADASLETETYRVLEIVPSEEDYVAPEKISVEKTKGRTTMKKGDIYVPLAQPAANLIPCLLEPESEYGLIRYRMYNLTPAQGSVFPFIRVIGGRPPAAPYSGTASK